MLASCSLKFHRTNWYNRLSEQQWHASDAHIFFNNDTHSPFHCDPSLHLTLWRLCLSPADIKYFNKQCIRKTRTAVLIHLSCLLAGCLAGSLLHRVRWRLRCCFVKRNATVVGVEAWRRETKGTRVKKKKETCRNKHEKIKQNLPRLDWNGCSPCLQFSREFERPYAVERFRRKTRRRSQVPLWVLTFEIKRDYAFAFCKDRCSLTGLLSRHGRCRWPLMFCDFKSPDTTRQVRLAICFFFQYCLIRRGAPECQFINLHEVTVDCLRDVTCSILSSRYTHTGSF